LAVIDELEPLPLVDVAGAETGAVLVAGVDVALVTPEMGATDMVYLGSDEQVEAGRAGGTDSG
jgi:hypothetical protein